MKAKQLFSAFLTSFALLFALSVPAFAAGEGYYSGAFASVDGESFPIEQVWPAGCALELREDGEAVLALDGSPMSCRWHADGGSLTLELGGRSYRGSVSGGAVSLELDGVSCVFLRSGADYVPGEGEGPIAAASGALSLWNGDWYGLWRISNASGDWAGLEGQCFDLFGRCLVSADAKGRFTLWDSRLSAATPMAELELEIVGAAEDVMGAAMIEGGWFWLMDVSEALWGMGSNVNGFEGLIALENVRYESLEGGFDLTLLLRPWGTLWEDVAAIDPASLPDNYYNWYLPLVQSGSAMPDSFDMSLVSGTASGE